MNPFWNFSYSRDHILSFQCFLLELRISVPKIAKLFHQEIHQIRYLMKKNGLSSRSFVNLSDDELDMIVEDLLELYPNAGTISFSQ